MCVNSSLKLDFSSLSFASASSIFSERIIIRGGNYNNTLQGLTSEIISAILSKDRAMRNATFHLIWLDIPFQKLQYITCSIAITFHNLILAVELICFLETYFLNLIVYSIKSLPRVEQFCFIILTFAFNIILNDVTVFWYRSFRYFLLKLKEE